MSHEVMVDGARYTRADHYDSDAEKALAYRMQEGMDAEGLTVRDYLHKLLSTLWREGECFRGKSPFGNSGWAFELVNNLVIGGFIEGTVEEEDGEIWDVSCDRQAAYQYVHDLIRYCFFGPKNG